MTKRYDLIVFDWDGTVMDSTAEIVNSIQAACRDLGLPEPSAEAARQVIGLGLGEALSQAVPQATGAHHEQLVEHYRRHFIARDSSITLFAGARETITELYQSGYLLAVATGKSRRGLDRAWSESDMSHFFHTSRTADQSFSKPHPAMLLEIIDELEVSPERTLMVGDTTHDLQMAINAGVAAVGLTHGAHPAEQLLECQPLALLGNYAELRTWFRAHA